jgi:hypothetical protein
MFSQSSMNLRHGIVVGTIHPVKDFKKTACRHNYPWQRSVTFAIICKLHLLYKKTTITYGPGARFKG